MYFYVIVVLVIKESWEVFGYGNFIIGDENDFWIVEVVDDIYIFKKNNEDGCIYLLII